MDQDKTPGIQPLPLGQPVANASAAAQPASAAAPSLDERVDQWLDSHPENKTFDDKTAVATTETPAPEQPAAVEAAPGGEVVPGTTVSPPAEAPVAEKPAVTEKPADKPEAKAPTVEPPKPAAPPEPVRFSLDAKYRFNEGGPEWSGQQIVDGLRERQALIPKAQEADVYAEVFEMPAAQAKELWAPNIAWMKQNPQHVQMLASIMEDPIKGAYLLDCASYWDSPEGKQLRAQAAPQAQPQMSPDVEARFKQLETQNQQLLAAENSRKQVLATDRITRELNVAMQRYPFLRDNPSLVQSLLARAWMLNGGDDSANSKGVLDALEEQKVLYDSQLAALNQASSIARQAGAPPTPAEPPPPLLGAAGASPQATQPMRVATPKKFTTLDDAVDDWVSNPPSQFR